MIPGPSIEIPLEDTRPNWPESPALAVSEDDLSGLVLSRRYELIRQLGRGGMGAVYLGRHIALERKFAVKVLNRHYSSEKYAIQRFIREARATAQLHHENVVEVYDFGINQGWIYLVMEYLDGEDLAATLRRDGPMPWHRAARVLLQVCAALQAAHQRRIIHRDIKPSNCFRVIGDAREDFIKVLDFGVAKVLEGGANDRSAPATEAQTVVGTPEYMAPEGFAGGPIDGRIDVYAVGMLGYHLLTGKLPFLRTAPEFMQKVCAGVARPPSSVAPRLRIPQIADVILMRALRPSASERFQTISELGAALAAAIEPPPVSPSTATPMTITLGGTPADDEGGSTQRQTTQPDGPMLPWRLILASSGAAAVITASLTQWPMASAPQPASAPVLVVAATPADARVNDESSRLELEQVDEEEVWETGELEPPTDAVSEWPADAPLADAPRMEPASTEALERPIERPIVARRVRRVEPPRSLPPTNEPEQGAIPLSVPAEPLWSLESLVPRRSDMLRPGESAEEETLP